MYLQRNNQAGLRWNSIWLALPLVATPIFAFAADLEISEIAWMGTANSAQDEWVELRNATGDVISLEGWTLGAADGQPLIALSGSVSASGFFLLERTNDDTVSGIAADLIYTGALENGGEVLELKNAAGIVVDRVDAAAGWPAGSNSTKETMQKNSVGVWVTAAATPKTAPLENASPPPEPPPPILPPPPPVIPPPVAPPPVMNPPPHAGPPPQVLAVPPPYSTKPPPPANSPPPNLDVRRPSSRPSSQPASPPAVVVNAALANPSPVPSSLSEPPSSSRPAGTLKEITTPAKVLQKKEANPPPIVSKTDSKIATATLQADENKSENQEALLAKFFSKSLIGWGVAILALAVAAAAFAISLRRENEKLGDQRPPRV